MSEIKKVTNDQMSNNFKRMLVKRKDFKDLNSVSQINALHLFSGGEIKSMGFRRCGRGREKEQSSICRCSPSSL